MRSSVASPAVNPSAPRPRLLGVLSVKAKTVLSAVVVVGAALSGAGFLLVAELNHSQLHGVDQALRVNLASIGALAKGGSFPQPLQLALPETSFVQVVDATGRVVASSASLNGEGRVLSVAPARGVTFFTRANLPLGTGERYRVAVAAVATPAGPMIAYVGESLAVVDQATHDLTWGLAIADPVLLVIVGLTVWWLVRRALSPIEAIRSEVESISGSDLGRRVVQPVVHDEIGRLAITMNRMLDRLEDASARQRSFVADASHELKSPLAAAQTELEVSLTHEASTNWAESARVTLDELERVRRIVDDLAILARFDEGAMPRVERPVDLEEIVMDECLRLRRLSPIEVDVTRVSGARVVGDPEQLGRVVRNLLDNARQHTRGRVAVSLTEVDGEAELRVSDDGAGIVPEDRSRIFERFVRVDDARTRANGGSGLGLAIVAEILSAHHGTIEVGDTTSGAEFIVRLPVSA